MLDRNNTGVRIFKKSSFLTNASQVKNMNLKFEFKMSNISSSANPFSYERCSHDTSDSICAHE